MSSSQLTFIFFRGVGIPPTSQISMISTTNPRTKWAIFNSYFDIPSGKLLQNYGQSPFYSWVNPRTKWAIFNSYVCMFTRPGNLMKPSFTVGSKHSWPFITVITSSEKPWFGLWHKFPKLLTRGWDDSSSEAKWIPIEKKLVGCKISPGNIPIETSHECLLSGKLT